MTKAETQVFHNEWNYYRPKRWKSIHPKLTSSQATKCNILLAHSHMFGATSTSFFREVLSSSEPS